MDNSKIKELRIIVEDFKNECKSQFPELSNDTATINDLNKLSEQIYNTL